MDDSWRSNENATIPTRDKMRADLARAMGWKVIKTNSGFMPISPEGHAQLNYKTEDFAWATMPDPSTNAADKDALVKWLAEDDARWKEFKQELLSDWVSSPEQDVVRFVLTAPLETIAEAAFFAITR